MSKKNKKPLISIVTVVGPRKKIFIYKLLQSVQRSIYQNFEIIVVDNCQDKKIKSRVIKFPKTKYLSMPANVGISAFNAGFKTSKGKYILALDDDCTINPDTLKNIADIFPLKPKKVAVLSTNIYKPLAKKYCFESNLKNKNKKLIIAANMAVFKKSVFKKVGYYDPDFFLWVHEDDLSIRILSRGYEIHFEPKIIVNHFEAKKLQFRKNMAFYLSRNLAWFNIKHFNLVYFPLLILRNLITFALMPFKRKAPQALFYCFAGYIWGYINFYIPLKKRNPVKNNLQIKFIKFYFFNQLK
jgi:GT2 family glycosyltransferase